MKNFNGVEIYENLGEIVHPGHSCLVVWDVQNGLVDRIFNKESFMERLKKLVETLRGKMPALYTLITPPPPGFQSSWALYSMMKRYRVDDPSKLPVFMAPGSKEREVPSSVAPRPGDLTLEKPTANIFLGTNFENLMRNRGVTTLLFTGIATEMGVEASARDAAARGFYPVVVSDCVSSADKDAHERSLLNMSKMFIVEESAAILKTLG